MKASFCKTTHTHTHIYNDKHFDAAPVLTYLCVSIFADLVCQSGPGPWPSEIYAQSAIYPMAHSAAQVIFFSNISSHCGNHLIFLVCEWMLDTGVLVLMWFYLVNLFFNINLVIYLRNIIFYNCSVYEITTVFVLYWFDLECVPYAGCFSSCSWRYRLPDIFARLWKHSRPGHYLSPWRLFLPYHLWYSGETIVCITTAILVQIYLNGIFISSHSKELPLTHPNTDRPGSIQARGDNLFSILKAFANSSMLKTAHERESHEATTNSEKNERAVFFDYLSLFMVCYKVDDQCCSLS